MRKKIKFISLTLAILGLLSESVALFNINTVNYFIEIASIRAFFSSLNLTFFNSTIIEHLNFDSGFCLNYLNTSFYCLLLIGTILFSISKGKEIRLLQFVMSIVLISNILTFLDNIISQVLHYKDFAHQQHWFIYWILAIIKHTLFAYASYYVLSNLKDSKMTVAETNNETLIENIDASRWQRLGHLIIDICICIFIFSQFTTVFVFSQFTTALLSSILQSISIVVGDRFATHVFYLISSLIYFPFFEFIFGATPAKFLTQTKVVKENGERLDFKTIMTRTLSRHIPFEAFSFLGGQGWHDSISKTNVVCDSKNGVKD